SCIIANVRVINAAYCNIRTIIYKHIAILLIMCLLVSAIEVPACGEVEKFSISWGDTAKFQIHANSKATIGIFTNHADFEENR
ncbi:hypothetical protein, partial [Vibrio parahaemolyticus]|uniref:hypothetical protein n=1 Tax=Vibrio parahaemolyticus TaxID=670 RepID=UPI001BAF15B0